MIYMFDNEKTVTNIVKFPINQGALRPLLQPRTYFFPVKSHVLAQPSMTEDFCHLFSHSFQSSSQSLTHLTHLIYLITLCPSCHEMKAPIETQMTSLLDRRKALSSFRTLTTFPSSSIDFSSNDFLSLSTSPILREAYLNELHNHPNFKLGSTGK